MSAVPGHAFRHLGTGIYRCECEQHLGTNRPRAREFYRFHIADVTGTMVLSANEFNRPARPELAPTRFCKQCGEEKPREQFPTRERLCGGCYPAVVRERSRGTRRKSPVRPRTQKLPKPEVERKTRVGPGLIADVIRNRIYQQDPVTVLTRAASWVESTKWLDEDPRPDVIRCLLSSCGPQMEAFAREDHWDYSGAYVPAHVARQAVKGLMDQRSPRKAYILLLDLLTKAAGIEDLETWSQEYSTGPTDVIDLFVRAAGLVDAHCA